MCGKSKRLVYMCEGIVNESKVRGLTPLELNLCVGGKDNLCRMALLKQVKLPLALLAAFLTKIGCLSCCSFCQMAVGAGYRYICGGVTDNNDTDDLIGVSFYARIQSILY